ncbi:MAG: hypothetical protein RLZZ241_645 [Bacteroidota bacterium]|jgi:hypothetical protein
MKIIITISFILVCILYSSAQTESFSARFFETYDSYREPSLNKRRIKQEDILPLINRFARQQGFEVNLVGKSIEGRSLHLISLGSGTTDIFLWSQMHGDEPTATQAIFDLLNFFKAPDFKAEKDKLLKRVRIHFLPMLNPDGAAVFQRRNFLGVDINRDAITLQSAESQVLKRVRDSLDAEFGFNLHDQSRYYNAERTSKPATISFLAPAYNYEKDINDVRLKAMQVIGYMNRILQEYAPGQVGRYNDDFEPRAFGDNIQKWGTSAILIESGGFPEDIEKQEIRKLNYVSILSAIYAIGSGSYENVALSDYFEIPKNDRMLFDLKIEGVTYPLNEKNYVLDFGIFRSETDLPGHADFLNVSQIGDMGDLSTYYAYQTVHAQGLVLKPGKVYDKVVSSLQEAAKLDFQALLKQGITYVRVAHLEAGLKASPYPMNLVSEGFLLPENKWDVGNNATFVLYRDNEPVYVILNGFLVETTSEKPVSSVKNGAIFK